MGLYVLFFLGVAGRVVGQGCLCIPKVRVFTSFYIDFHISAPSHLQSRAGSWYPGTLPGPSIRHRRHVRPGGFGQGTASLYLPASLCPGPWAGYFSTFLSLTPHLSCSSHRLSFHPREGWTICLQRHLAGVTVGGGWLQAQGQEGGQLGGWEAGMPTARLEVPSE